jgi:hypothetical protein
MSQFEIKHKFEELLESLMADGIDPFEELKDFDTWKKWKHGEIKLSELIEKAMTR